MIFRKEQVTGEAENHLSDYAGSSPVCLFDIETTGLSRRGTSLYMIGAISRENDRWMLRQWFLDSPLEEKVLLKDFSAFLSEIRERNSEQPVLVHFNGDTFDIPYVRYKCSVYRLPDPFEGFGNTDLFRRLSPYRSIFGLTKMRQKDLEQFCGVSRQDEMDGGRLIDVYKEFLESKDRALEELLFLHNHDDVTGMAGLLPLLSVPDFFENRPENFRAEQADDVLRFYLRPRRDFPSSVSEKIFPMTARFVKSKNRHAGRGNQDPVNPDSPAVPGLQLELKGEELLLTVTLTAGTMKHFFRDYKNYYYLPEEDQAIHKDIAVYTDPDHREKAKPATCYQKKEGIFCPELSEQIEPVFYTDYRSWPPYFMPEESFLSDGEAVAGYLSEILSLFLR